jgi:hypothetical protein
MFQYALARILSQKFNQKIDTRPPKFFFIEDEKTKDFKIYQKNILVDDANFLEILELENLNSTNIIISGYFQNKLFISKYCKKILELFNINYENKKGIFLHYRLGDIEKEYNRLVAHEYYIYSLYEILNTICSELNRALGNINNLETIIEEETNSIKIIDLSECRNCKHLYKFFF